MAKSQRVEVRVAAASANPCFAPPAATRTSGLHGIEHGPEPSEPVVGSAFVAEVPEALRFPATLGGAAARLHGSAVAHEWFGDAFDHCAAVPRGWEVHQYRAAITDTDRKLRRCFEIV